MTATALAVLTAGGLAACHDGSRHARAAHVSPITPGAPGGTPDGVSGDVSPSVHPSASPAPTPARTHSPSPRRTSPPARRTSATPAHRSADLPPVISRIPVRQKIVFITIDDGWEKDADFVRLVRERRIPLTVFLTNAAAKEDYGYFRQLQQAGALIEDHTMTHPYLPRLSYARQKHEICATADIYAREYHARPTLFRAPYGATTRATLRAAKACGIKAIFFWREVVTHGRIAYQVPGRLHPGDIVLVHFNPHMTHDFTKMLRTIREQGFTPAPLRGHLPDRYLR